MKLSEQIAIAIDAFVLCGGDIDMESLITLIEPHTTQLEADRDEYRNLYHMGEAKITSREAIIEQLSESELAKDVTRLEGETEGLNIQEGESAGRYVERQIMDIFQRVAELVGNGLLELDHPAPIIRGSIVMTNAWNKYLLTKDD